MGNKGCSGCAPLPVLPGQVWGPAGVPDPGEHCPSPRWSLVLVACRGTPRAALPGSHRALGRVRGGFPGLLLFSLLRKHLGMAQGGSGTSSPPPPQEGTRGGQAPQEPSWEHRLPRQGIPGMPPQQPHSPRATGISRVSQPRAAGGQAGGDKGATIRDSRTDSVPAFRLRVGQSSSNRTRWPLAAARRSRPRGFWGR